MPKCCDGKHKHKSEGAAISHKEGLKRRFPKMAERFPYLCPYCGNWHVGRRKKSKIPVDSSAGK